MKNKAQQNNGGNLITNYMTFPKGKSKNGSKATEHKKQQEDKIDYHQSSMEAQLDSRTQILESGGEQQWIEQRPEEICLQLIMIAPFDTSYYKGFKRKAKDLRNNYNRDNAVKFILENAKYEGVTNLRNLQKIEDEEFWNRTVPTLLEYAEEDRKQRSISSKIRMLIPKKNQNLSLTKAQVFMVIVNMFLCIFPKQTNRKTSHYNLVQLMTITDKDGEATSSMKLQKLKCLVNYLKVMSKRKYKELENQYIEYQRCVSDIQQAQYRNVEYRMKEAEIKVGCVQDSYQHDLIIDFANKNIGGGVLNRGAVQEEILFCVFPELLFSLVVCYELKDNQSLIVYGAEKINLYSGYSDTFKFMGTFHQDPKDMGPFKSIIVAVDAMDFKNSSYRQHHQYQTMQIERELQKFLGGIRGADYGADEKMKVCTGKWGCGAFGGNTYLKFIIQWIACSMANKDMIFTCQEEQKYQLQVLVKFLRRFDSLEILEIVEEYSYCEEFYKQFSFIEFIKKYSS